MCLDALHWSHSDRQLRSSGYLIRNERERSGGKVEEEEEQEEECKEEEEEVQVSVPSVQTVTASAPQQIFVSGGGRKVRAASDYIGHVYDDGAPFCGHVAPTDYRLFVLLLMTGTGLYVPRRSEEDIKNNKPEKRRKD